MPVHTSTVAAGAVQGWGREKSRDTAGAEGPGQKSQQGTDRVCFAASCPGLSTGEPSPHLPPERQEGRGQRPHDLYSRPLLPLPSQAPPTPFLSRETTCGQEQAGTWPQQALGTSLQASPPCWGRGLRGTRGHFRGTSSQPTPARHPRAHPSERPSGEGADTPGPGDRTYCWGLSHCVYGYSYHSDVAHVPKPLPRPGLVLPVVLPVALGGY